MIAGNWKSYADFVSKTDWMEPDYDSPSKDELWEQWIEDWEKDNEVTDVDKDTEYILYEFFDKIVYHDYFDGNSNYADWSLKEIKEKLLDWFIENYNKTIEQLGNLIRDVQRNRYEETEVLTKSRHLYSNLTGSCI